SDLADSASGNPLRRTGPSSHQTIQISAHVENDSATPKSGLSDRTTESSSQPSTSAVIFDPDADKFISVVVHPNPGHCSRLIKLILNIIARNRSFTTHVWHSSAGRET